MQKFSLFGVASLVALVCGCTQGTPGGPGVQPSSTPQTYSTNKPVVNDSKDTFSLRMPMLSTSLKQGETRSVVIAVNRGNDFMDDVNLQFSSTPDGVSIDPAAPMISKSDKDVKINVTASDNAALGDFKVKVTGHPTKGGPDAENELKITVSAK